jgi:hypothetical protein
MNKTKKDKYLRKNRHSKRSKHGNKKNKTRRMQRGGQPGASSQTYTTTTTETQPLRMVLKLSSKEREKEDEDAKAAAAAAAAAAAVDTKSPSSKDPVLEAAELEKAALKESEDKQVPNVDFPLIWDRVEAWGKKKLIPGTTTAMDEDIEQKKRMVLIDVSTETNENTGKQIKYFNAENERLLSELESLDNEIAGYESKLQLNEQLSQQEMDKLTELKTRLNNKAAKFEDLAKLYSNDLSASKGGDLGWVYPGDTVPEFERAMNALQPGQVSEPVESPFGYHLIQVVERKTEEISRERLRLTARQALRDRKLEEAYEDWLRQLRDRAYVEYRQDEINQIR